MNLTVRFSSVSGFHEDFCAIAHRFDADSGFSPQACESWVIHTDDSGEFNRCFGGPAWLTDVWYSETSRAYITDSRGELTVLKDANRPGKGVQTKHELGAALMGVSGATDELVVAWGDSGPKHLMFRWDGKRWSDMPSPDGVVLDVAVVGTDLMMAVGEKGLIARWDGKRWHTFESPTRTHVSSIVVASPDEMYATAGRALLEGSVHGWAKSLEAKAPLLGVAMLGKDLWVGGGENGLYRRKQKKLEVVKDNLEAEQMEGRKGLVVSANDFAGSSVDCKGFNGPEADAVIESLEDTPPGWR